MRITTSAFLALAASASADVKVSSEAGQRLMSKARELGNSDSSSNTNNNGNSNGDAASSYMSTMKYYQNSWNGNGNGEYYTGGSYGNNQDQNANQNYQGDQQGDQEGDAQDENNQNDGYQRQYASGNQFGGSGGSTNWMSDYSIKFDGCATDYESNGDGSTTTELLARFKLCPNSSGKRCRHAGEYVLPMAEYVDATQNSFMTDDNCRLQEETCYSQCQDQARYGSAYGDDDNNGGDNNGGRRLQYWWQQWGTNAEKSSKEEEEDAEAYQEAKYSNSNYQQYNGGNNGVAQHNGDYDASDQGTYQSAYQAQMQEYQQSSTTSTTGTTGSTGTTESEQYDVNNYYYNRGNWRNNGDNGNNGNNGSGGNGGTGSGSTGSSGASDSSNVNQDNSYWGGYDSSSGNSGNSGNSNQYNQNQNSYSSNGNGNDGRNADYNNYFDEDYCRYDCMSDAGMAYCSENTEKNGQNGYNDLNVPAMVDCQPLNYFDSSTKPLYTGAACRNGGVYLDTFTDSACTQTAPKGTFEEAIGYNLPDQNLVNNDMLKCSSAQTIAGYFETQDQFDNYDEYSEYAANQYESSAGLCDVLYRDSGRCETYLKKDGKDESGCDYINRMGNSSHAGVWLRYGIGFVIAACFLLAAYIGYSRGRREEGALVVEAVRSSVTSMFNKANKSLKQPLAPENDTETMCSAAAPGYIGAKIPVAGELMTTAPIPPPIVVQHDEEPTEVKKENNVV